MVSDAERHQIFSPVVASQAARHDVVYFKDSLMVTVAAHATPKRVALSDLFLGLS